MCQGKGEGMEEARKVVMLEKEVNPSAFYAEVIMVSVGVQVQGYST